MVSSKGMMAANSPVLLVRPRASEHGEALEGELRATEFEIELQETSASGALMPASVAAVVLDVTDLDPEATVHIATDYCRHAGAPVVIVGGPVHGTTMLELMSLGITDVVPVARQPEELRTRLLAAIERRATERELRLGYAGFRRLFEEAVSPIAIAIPEGRFLAANTAMCEVLGYSASEFPALTVAAVTHPDDASTLDLFEELASGHRRRYRVRKRFVAKDGTVVWADLSATRIVEPDTGAVQLIGEFHNLTREVESRRALNRSRHSYRMLFEQIPVPALVLDGGDLRILDANEAAESTYGYTQAELLEHTMLDLWTPAAQAKAAAAELLRSDHAIGPTLQRHRRKDGSFLDAQVRSVQIDEGERPARLVLATDVTAQRELERSLETARAEASSSRLAAETGHTVNNFATVLLAGCTRLLESLGEAHELRTTVLGIRDVGQRMTELTRELMSRARLAGNQPAPLELNSALEERLELLRALLGAGVELSWRPSDDELPIRFDPRDLDQILLNLAANARDAMSGRGRLVLTARRQPLGDGASGHVARLSVSDTGPGFDDEILDDIFDAYFTTKPGGTGLGLSTVRRLVSQAGGRVLVESPPGQGATFHLDLLLDRTRLVTGAAPEVPHHGDGADIVLVDDDEAVCLLVREMLEAAGHRVFTATSGERALAGAAAAPGALDLVIADATLTHPTTPELVERLRLHQPQLKVLVTSGYLEDVLIARGVLGGDTPFLPKPFSAGELRAAVEQVLHTGP